MNPKAPHFKGLQVVLSKTRKLFKSIFCNMHPDDAFGLEILCIVMEVIFHSQLKQWLRQRH